MTSLEIKYKIIFLILNYFMNLKKNYIKINIKIKYKYFFDLFLRL